MATNEKVRLNRLFAPSGRCLNVAIDHGVFNEPSFLEGLEKLGEVVRQLVTAGPDAIQMNYGQAGLLQQIAGPGKPALVLRADCGNPYNTPRADCIFDVLAHHPDPVLPAVQMDAACVVVNLLLLPGEAGLHRQTIENIARIRPFCDQYRMPLMVEPLVMKVTPKSGFAVDGSPGLLVPLVRQARELGADLIKADPTDRAEDYHRVVEAAGCPVLVRGGGKEPVEKVFEKAHALLEQGAKGLVYGRNIYQHPNPAKIVRALRGVIHDGWTPEQALATYRSSG